MFHSEKAGAECLVVVFFLGIASHDVSAPSSSSQRPVARIRLLVQRVRRGLRNKQGTYRSPGSDQVNPQPPTVHRCSARGEPRERTHSTGQAQAFWIGSAPFSWLAEWTWVVARGPEFRFRVAPTAPTPLLELTRAPNSAGSPLGPLLSQLAVSCCFNMAAS